MNRSYAHIYGVIGEKHLPGYSVRQRIILPTALTNPSKKIVYVVLGDSLTAGVGASAEDKTYPYQLAALLAEEQKAQVTLVNLAVPGAAAGDVLRDQVPQVAQFHPDVVLVAVGINDMHNRVSSEIFSHTMSEIVDRLTRTTQHLNVINIPFIGSREIFLPPYRFYFNLQTKQYNSLLDEVLVNRQANVIDLYGLTRGDAMLGQEYYAADGFHPSDYGYAVWADSLYDYLDY